MDIGHVTDTSSDQPPTLSLAGLSTAAKVIAVHTACERRDCAVDVGCNVAPLRHRKQTNLLHRVQETDGGSAHKKGTASHSLRTIRDYEAPVSGPQRPIARKIFKPDRFS